MSLIQTTLRTVVAMGLVGATIVAPTTVAQAVNDGEWTFTGSLSAPARSLSSETVTASGTITVSQGVLELASCADPSLNPPEAVPFLRNVSNGSMTGFTSGAVVITGTNPVPFSASATVSPGSYDLVLQYRCNGGSFSGYLSSTPGAAVSIASEVGSPTYLTLACVTTVPPMACTSQIPQASALPSGYSVTFAGVVRRVWSDGVTTEDPVTGSQRLEYRPLGLVTFSPISTSCATTITISDSREYRCVLGSTPMNIVSVQALTPTNDFVLGPTRVQPYATSIGEDVVVSGSISQYYSNRTLWPAKPGTEYRIQFQSEGSSMWRQIGPTLRLGVAGNVGATISMPGSGKIRVVVGAFASTPADVIELRALDEYEISTNRVPISVNPGDEVAFSGSVRQKWSDGPFRDVGSGTNVEFEFSEAYDSATAARNWESLTSVRTVSAIYRLDTIPQSSGFWRIRVGNTVTSERYIQVNGSAPASLNADLSPVQGSIPFAGGSSRFSVEASVGGYVGTELLDVWARVGSATPVRIGQVGAGQEFSSLVTVPLPVTPGYYRPSIEVRNPRGRVLSSVVGSEFMVDGVVELEPVLNAPNRTLISGERSRVTVELQEILFSGEIRPASWSGRLQMQVNRGEGWKRASRWTNARGSSVKFKVAVFENAQYRVRSRGLDVSEESTSFEFPDSPGELLARWPDRVSKSRGLKVRVAINAGDGEKWLGRGSIYLEYRAPRQNKWRRQDAAVYKGKRAIRLATSVVKAGCYRVISKDLELEDRAGYGVRSCDR